MKDPRTIEGQWWIHGNDREPLVGILKFVPDDDLTLSVRTSRPVGLEESWSLFTPIADCTNVIHGLDEHAQPVTLLGCTSGGYESTRGVRKRTVYAMAALLGAHVGAWNEPRFLAVRFNFSLLHNWVNRKFYRPQTSAEPRMAIELELPPEVIIELADGVKMRLVPDFSGGGSISEHSFKFDHSIYLHFPQPVSAEAISTDFIPTLLHLLTLLTGEVVFLDDCTLFESDPYDPRPTGPVGRVTLLRCCSGIAEARRDRTGHHMVTQFHDIAADLPNIVNKWFELDDRLQPVVDLFMLVRSDRAPTLEIRFLLLAQALEAYHSRIGAFTATELPRADHRARVAAIVACVPAEQQEWLRDKLAFSNQKTLAARLADIFARHEAEVRAVTTGISDFAAKVRYTRNYYTHYGEELLEDGRVAQGDELIRITFALEAIVGVCLLKELGIHGPPIQKFLHRYTNMTSTQLSPAPQVSPASGTAESAAPTSEPTTLTNPPAANTSPA